VERSGREFQRNFEVMLKISLGCQPEDGEGFKQKSPIELKIMCHCCAAVHGAATRRVVRWQTQKECQLPFLNHNLCISDFSPQSF
jgi:hypothetical protein